MSKAKANSPDGTYWVDLMGAVTHQRDRESFMRIYDHFAPRVRLYLVGLGLPDAVAEELAQEALLRLWERSALYDASRGALSTWLFRIARNLHVDRLRREPNWVVLEDDSEHSDGFEDNRSPGPERLAEQAQLESRIDLLSAVQARLIRMSYFEAKTHQEIAGELDMPLGTVKSHLRRAFLQLQKGIQQNQ